MLKFSHITSLVVFVIATLSLSSCTLTVAPPPPDFNASGVVRVNADIDTLLIDTGWLDGKVTGAVRFFKGIPYAEPPVGELRWRAPQAVVPWTGIRDATAFGPDCMQLQSGIEKIQTTPSEDCLYLNVWTPARIEPTSKLPVMVWIHGGGFVGGGSSIPYYDGTAFARQGIVVVSFNYRLGRFGFFAHPALLAADEGPVGNFGYMDQIAALKWVQRNITAFGGDPARVTLVGESAGGASALTMLTSPQAQGLFDQVVVMSGGGRKALVLRPMTDGTAENPSADQSDAAFAASLGIEGDDRVALAALRALPAEQLVGDLDLSAVLKEDFRCPLIELMSPIATECVPVFDGVQMMDGTIVRGQPGDVIQSGGAAQAPIIIGTTAVDLPLYFPPDLKQPYAYFGEDAGKARAHYSLAPDVAQSLVASGHPELVVALPILSIGADMTMHEAARFTAREMSAQGNPAWLYRFTYSAETERPSSGQSHAGELPFLFDTLAARYPGVVTDNDQAMAEAFNTYIANFVKTGDPNGDALPAWPQFDPATYDLMNFTADDGPVYGEDPRAAGIEVVERAADAQAK